jgi:hypothetical protein
MVQVRGCYQRSTFLALSGDERLSPEGAILEAFRGILSARRCSRAQQPESGRGGLGGSWRNQRNCCCASCASATLRWSRSVRISVTYFGRGAWSWRQRQMVIRLTQKDLAAAASLPKATLNKRSCRPPGTRRSKRDRVTTWEQNGINVRLMWSYCPRYQKSAGSPPIPPFRSATTPQRQYYGHFQLISKRNMQSVVAVADAQEMLEPSALLRCGGSRVLLGQIAHKGILELRELVAFRRPRGCADRRRRDTERCQLAREGVGGESLTPVPLWPWAALS